VNEYILYAAHVLPKSDESLTWFTAYNSIRYFEEKRIFFLSFKRNCFEINFLSLYL